MHRSAVKALLATALLVTLIAADCDGPGQELPARSPSPPSSPPGVTAPEGSPTVLTFRWPVEPFELGYLYRQWRPDIDLYHTGLDLLNGSCLARRSSFPFERDG